MTPTPATNHATSPATQAAANPQIEQLKAQMADIVEPNAIGFWPLAWGWWLLMALVITVLTGLVYWLVTRHRANAYRRHALGQISQLQPFSDRHQQAKALMVLTKRVALIAFPGERQTINRLSGAAWLQWLNARAPKPLFNDELGLRWQENLYRHSGDSADTELTESCRQWILRHQTALAGRALPQDEADTEEMSTPHPVANPIIKGEAHV